MIAVVGPTASGKTAFASALAHRIGAEIISGDSRQVYRRMDLGTGKDLDDYVVDGERVPAHLIDIVEPGTKYNVFEYQRDFLNVYSDLTARGVLPVLCGGTGMYVESVLRGYRLPEVPENVALRLRLAGKTLAELTELLRSYKQLHNTTDVDTVKRAIRAIEIEEYSSRQDPATLAFPHINTLVVGLDISRDTRRERISARLQQRLDNGMVEEVRGLLDEGIAPDDLIYYGLEYKYLTLYIIGRISYDEMYHGLETAIHQFAKRQMTWFRGMERRGIAIHWIDAMSSMQDKVQRVLELLG